MQIKMRKLLLFISIVIYGLLYSQPISQLPTTTTGASGDFLIKNDAAGGTGATKKISIANFITTYSLSTGSGISGLTTNKYTKALSATTIGDALLSDDGTNVIVPSGKYITSGNIAKSRIDFGTTGSELIYMTTDGGAGAESYLSLDGTTAAMAFGATATLDLTATESVLFNNTTARIDATGTAKVGTNVANSIEIGRLTKNTTIYGNTIINNALQYNVGTSLNGKVLTSDASGNASWQAASGSISGTGVTGRITKWTGASTIDTSTVLKETSGHINITNGSLLKSENGLNYANIGNSQSSLESDNGSGSTASLYSAATSAGALANDGVSLVEFFADATNNRFRVNTTAGGDVTLYSGTGGTISLTTGTVNIDGSVQIDDGTQSVGRVFTCTSGTTGAGTWQAIPGLTGATGSLISFSATNTATNISAGAAGTFLRFAGANTLPVVSTLVLPNSATANRLAYATATNTWGDNSLLTFDGTIFTANALKSNASGIYIGSSAASAVNICYFKSDQNTATLHRIENASGGTAAIGGFQMHNGTSGFNVYITGTGYTTAGSLVQSSGVVDCLASGGMSISASNASGDLRFNTAGTSAATQRVKITSTGNVILNSTGSALATTATNGFTYIPTCAGTPTGVPATLPTGALPIIIDSTNNKMYIYSGGAWVALN